MSFQKRKQEIVKIVEEKAEVSVKELASLVKTSEITIRRDLVLLASEGLIYRTHGGAMRIDLARTPISFSQKLAQNAEKKDYICRLAAQAIQDGDIIFMDCGSTIFHLCQFIKNKPIKVITNSLPVIYELMNTEVSLNVIGGELDGERQAVHGVMALEHIQKYSADKAFIGVDGISLAKGLTAKSEKEAEMSKAMSQQARMTYLLCDSTKINKDKYLQFADLKEIDVLITDASNEALADFRKIGLEVWN
jgi:DeoR family fructose operon transcriptional repressor